MPQASLAYLEYALVLKTFGGWGIFWLCTGAGASDVVQWMRRFLAAEGLWRYRWGWDKVILRAGYATGTVLDPLMDYSERPFRRRMVADRRHHHSVQQASSDVYVSVFSGRPPAAAGVPATAMREDPHGTTQPGSPRDGAGGNVVEAAAALAMCVEEASEQFDAQLRRVLDRFMRPTKRLRQDAAEYSRAFGGFPPFDGSEEEEAVTALDMISPSRFLSCVMSFRLGRGIWKTLSHPYALGVAMNEEEIIFARLDAFLDASDLRRDFEDEATLVCMALAMLEAAVGGVDARASLGDGEVARGGEADGRERERDAPRGAGSSTWKAVWRDRIPTEDLRDPDIRAKVESVERVIERTQGKIKDLLQASRCAESGSVYIRKVVEIVRGWGTACTLGIVCDAVLEA